jgi:hypothetical protein
MCQNDGEVYARLLLPKKFGFPLWIPQPHRNLPREYRRNGVNIGDVGIITSGGVFDFLFNVCLPSHHSINGGRVPNDFKPLDPPEPVDIINVTVASTYIASRSIERSELRLNNPVLHLYHWADTILLGYIQLELMLGSHSDVWRPKELFSHYLMGHLGKTVKR